MSHYLIDRIGALSNVDLHVGTEVVALGGDRSNGLTAVTLRERTSGATRTSPLRHPFLFIGADPNAAWLEHRIAVDAKGFVVTGFDCPHGAVTARRAALPLETSMPGCSRSAMFAPARPSVSPRPWAKAQPSWRRSTPCLRLRQSLRDALQRTNRRHRSHGRNDVRCRV